jgi:hypothetical protein
MNSKMDFIRSINSSQLNELIKSASDRVILALPGLFKENSEVIALKYSSGFKRIKVILNCSEKLIRQGYGEINAILELKKIGVPLFNQPDNLVSFIISDNKGYFLFPQSRIFLEDSHNVRNAIEMDPFSLEQTVGLFFPPNLAEKKQFEDNLANAVILSSQRIQNIDKILIESAKIKVSNLDNETFNPVKAAIDANPPTHPDLKRNLEYYTTNFLWIKLEFKGANISNKTINIPPHILPIDSDELRKKLSSHIKLFENLEKLPWYYKLKKINNDEKALRKKYLHPIREKNGMNIISKSDLASFIKEIESIKNNISKTTLEIKETIDEEIEQTRSKFKEVLFDYYKTNYPKYFKKYTNDNLTNDVEEHVENLMSEIHFFGAEELFSNFLLNYHDFELTANDLDNKKLIDELKEKKILSNENINQLENRGKGYQSRLF